jgi:hypothetical protein
LAFAGDMPLGYRVRVMRADLGRLLECAQETAKLARQGLGGCDTELAVRISCVGASWYFAER